MRVDIVLANHSEEGGLNVFVLIVVLLSVIAILTTIMVVQQRDPDRPRRMEMRRALLGGARPRPEARLDEGHPVAREHLRQGDRDGEAPDGEDANTTNTCMQLRTGAAAILTATERTSAHYSKWKRVLD